MDDRLIKLGMSSDFSGFRETENENDKKCNTGNQVNTGKKREEDI